MKKWKILIMDDGSDEKEKDGNNYFEVRKATFETLISTIRNENFLPDIIIHTDRIIIPE